MTKTVINHYMQRSDRAAESCEEIKDSGSVVEFGRKHLSIPKQTSGMNERVFVNLKPEDVLKRKEEDAEKEEEGNTIAGVSTK